jgi:multisubunit Na+/H+ antiporter MnhC subunit
MNKLNKRGQTGGLITSLVMGVAGLVIGVIIAFVIVSTLTGAGLLTTDSAEETSTEFLAGNFTEGVDNVSDKIPTVLLVAAIVLILGVMAILVGVWQRMRLGQGGSL